jgi:hypothetical protein
MPLLARGIGEAVQLTVDIARGDVPEFFAAETVPSQQPRVVSDRTLFVLGRGGFQKRRQGSLIGLGAWRLPDAKLALGEDVAGLLAGIGKLDYA